MKAFRADPTIIGDTKSIEMKNLVTKKRGLANYCAIFLWLFLFMPAIVLSEGLYPVSHEVSGSDGENSSSFDKFKIEVVPAVEKTAEDEAFNVRISLIIPDKYKLYADKTAVTFHPDDNYTLGGLISPSPTVSEDPYLGEVKIYTGQVTFIQPVRSLLSGARRPRYLNVTIDYQGCSESGCFIPQTEELKVSLDEARFLPGGEVAPENDLEPSDRHTEMPGHESEENPFQRPYSRYGMVGAIIAAFLLGLAVSLTPCVYPMIPITVSVIGAGSSGNVVRGFFLSVVYVLGLSFTYAIFGTIAAVSGGLFGSIAGSPAARVVVAVVFILMALSMFDVFFVQMPTSVSSKLQRLSVSGYMGVFITGAVSGLIVGPCVGPPLVGLLAYIATLGSTFKGFFIMWSFALGLGMLFLFAGTFSGAISALPKAGMWMEKVKYFFGIIMLGAALYFLSPLLPETVFMITIGGLLIVAGCFAGGLDHINGDAPSLSRWWKAMGIVCIILGSGYILSQVIQLQMPAQASATVKRGIAWHEDEETALQAAKERGQPVIIDFAADWCSACRRMERDTFSNEKVIGALKDHILVKVDCTESNDPKVKDLLKKYRITGLPAIVFLNPDRDMNRQYRINDYIGPEDFLKKLTEFANPIRRSCRKKEK